MILGDPVAVKNQANTPLFRMNNGKALEGGKMLKMIRNFQKMISEPPALYGTHSLRIRGATALADAGCPDVVIMTMGRWSSQCYLRYCRAAFRSRMVWG